MKSLVNIYMHCHYYLTYQGKGYGTKLMDFAESLAPIQQVGVVSCRSDVMPIYKGIIHRIRSTFLKCSLELYQMIND